MCLEVNKSHVRKPIPEMECYKLLQYVGNGEWATPYQSNPVPQGTGWFMPEKPAKRKVREYRKGEDIYGGYLHASLNPRVATMFGRTMATTYETLPDSPIRNRCYRFKAVARDVVALGAKYRMDLVCRALYIPAFDKTGKHRNAILDM